jgi:hypothetical protein
MKKMGDGHSGGRGGGAPSGEEDGGDQFGGLRNANEAAHGSHESEAEHGERQRTTAGNPIDLMMWMLWKPFTAPIDAAFAQSTSRRGRGSLKGPLGRTSNSQPISCWDIAPLLPLTFQVKLVKEGMASQARTL